jgi:hypothetical protein
MPIAALESLLDRRASIAQAKDQIDIAPPLLQELVNKGTRPWEDASRKIAGTKNEHLAVIMLYNDALLTHY